MTTEPDNENMETPSAIPPPGPGPEADGVEQVIPSRRWWRRILLTLGPVLLLGVAGYFYVTGGRYIETDNAYVKADKVSLSAEISGPIVEVLFEENQPVSGGQVLFRIDPAPYQLAVNKARAHLLGMRALLESVAATYKQKQEELKRDIADRDYNERELNRLSELAKNKLASQANLDAAQHDRDTAVQQIAITREALEQLAAQLGGKPGSPLEEHPLYKESQAALDDALLNLEHTEVRAPYSGIAQNKPQPGQYVRAGEPVMVVVANRGMWIEANYKETELTHVKPGQPVDIRIDTYPGQRWRGTVESLSQASGSEFSLLPPQNATGNWVKVVQRIPVRITIQPQGDTLPLRAGMSTMVEIDTGYQRPLPGFVKAVLSPLRRLAGSPAIIAAGTEN